MPIIILNLKIHKNLGHECPKKALFPPVLMLFPWVILSLNDFTYTQARTHTHTHTWQPALGSFLPSLVSEEGKVVIAACSFSTLAVLLKFILKKQIASQSYQNPLSSLPLASQNSQPISHASQGLQANSGQSSLWSMRWKDKRGTLTKSDSMVHSWAAVLREGTNDLLFYSCGKNTAQDHTDATIYAHSNRKHSRLVGKRWNVSSLQHA